MDTTEYMKAYRLANKEKYKDYRKKWRAAHKDDEEYKAKNAIYHQTYHNRKKQMSIPKAEILSIATLSTRDGGSVIVI